ncbi:hypothetical protein C84B14_17553 [Salinisphaera sp. C84B14]
MIESCADTLHRHLAKQKERRCVLLTGPAELGAFSQDRLDECKAAGIAVSPVRVKHPNLDASYWPHAIALDLDRSRDADLARAAIRMSLEDWQPEALRQAHGHRIAGFLCTDVPLFEVCRHLSRVMLQPSPGGGHRLLSLLDPAALEGIWRIFNADQQTTLCGPVEEWHVVDRWFDWSVHVRPEGGLEGRRALGITVSQWSDLGNVRAINRAWAKAVSKCLPVSAQTMDELPAAMQRARQYGLHEAADLDAFAWHALSVRPDFDRDPRIQTRLIARDSETTYSLSVADLNPTDWEAIRRGWEAVNPETTDKDHA